MTKQQTSRPLTGHQHINGYITTAATSVLRAAFDRATTGLDPATVKARKAACDVAGTFFFRAGMITEAAAHLRPFSAAMASELEAAAVDDLVAGYHALFAPPTPAAG